MKFFVVASLAFLSGAYAESTITCSGCPSAVTTPDIVTRSALPTVSCTDKPLKIVPVSGASANKMGGAGMALAAAVAAVYLL
ncbi:hypothetical protein NXS19_008501 [Fusarium pseudograminearum]|nr:hypothetical protein NXS19_008501 [Fusarium pseudograminearum]